MLDKYNIKIQHLIVYNVLLGVLVYIITNNFYNNYDKNYYKCSINTHKFGVMFPLINIFFINILYYNNIISKKNYCILIIAIIALIFSYSMMIFHLIYHFNK